MARASTLADRLAPLPWPVDKVLASRMKPSELLQPGDLFVQRHLGPGEAEIEEMLATLGFESLEDLVDAVVPESIRINSPLNLGQPQDERSTLKRLRDLARKNQVCRSYIGMGYSNTHTPPVIQRNVLENPGWYTQYTPYQAEISQGRLEALMNFQTMVADLTGLPLANASLLDEATAAAEANPANRSPSDNSPAAWSRMASMVKLPRCSASRPRQDAAT